MGPSLRRGVLSPTNPRFRWSWWAKALASIDAIIAACTRISAETGVVAVGLSSQVGQEQQEALRRGDTDEAEMDGLCSRSEDDVDVERLPGSTMKS